MMTRRLLSLAACLPLVTAAFAAATPLAASAAAPEPAGGAASTAATSPPTGWVDEPVTFPAGEVTVHGTYRHPTGAARPVPGALLIAGSGPTDRNGNDTAYSHLDSLRAVADWLAADGVATLRYDKLFSGETGAGPYAGRSSEVGVDVFEQEARAAYRFLATRPDIDAHRLTIVGHSEGALYALLTERHPGPGAPVPHGLALIEPLSRRFLDVLAAQIEKQLADLERAGKLTAEQAESIRAALHDAVAQLRTQGTVPDQLPGGLSRVLSPANARYTAEIDRYDPARLAAELPHGMPVLVTCSDADIQVSCDDASRVVLGAALAGARLRPVQLHGVDHVLKEDDSRTADHYDEPLPFSRQLQAAFHRFDATRRW